MTQAEFKITPSVDAAQEFIEIATDFSNPLDLVREAISNSFDAKARTIRIAFTTIRDAGERVLFTEIEDDGTGKPPKGQVLNYHWHRAGAPLTPVVFRGYALDRLAKLRFARCSRAAQLPPPIGSPYRRMALGMAAC